MKEIIDPKARDARVKARPFCKWAGGKTSSLELLLKYAPKKIATYWEPMVGGGAFFFALANEKRFKDAILSDINPHLVATYGAIQLEPYELGSHLKKLKNTKREFLKMREAHPRVIGGLKTTAVRFLYLNKTGFNGLWRENQKGLYNVPFGHYKNPKICDQKNLLACSDVLQLATITTSDYQKVIDLKKLRKKDFIYFDPPYVPVSETSNFTSFTGGSWRKLDHERLALFFRVLAKRGVPMMLSNSDTALSRKLYKGFKIVSTKVRRNVSCKGDGRDPVGEILVLANL